MNDPATISKLSSLRRREAAPFNKTVVDNRY
jgi:hypothetical protein